jgi:hypothetical protein
MGIKVFGNSRSVYYAIDMLEENKGVYLGRVLNDPIIYEIVNFIKNNIRKHELLDPEGEYDKRIGIVVSKAEKGIISVVECDSDGN